MFYILFCLKCFGIGILSYQQVTEINHVVAVDLCSMSDILRDYSTLLNSSITVVPTLCFICLQRCPLNVIATARSCLPQPYRGRMRPKSTCAQRSSTPQPAIRPQLLEDALPCIPGYHCHACVQVRLSCEARGPFWCCCSSRQAGASATSLIGATAGQGGTATRPGWAVPSPVPTGHRWEQAELHWKLNCLGVVNGSPLRFRGAATDDVVKKTALYLKN